jgi:phosphate transport system substrate-binding protein
LDLRQEDALQGALTRRALIAASGSAALLAGGIVRAEEPVHLLETGSTLLYPLFNLWVADYQKTREDVQITTQGTGSGTGISEAISGIAQIGASDAYMADAQMKKSPGILNIPLAVSSQMINYNLPGLNDKHLKLSGPALAAIYSGTVKFWDDPILKQLNPGLDLPHQGIIPVHRTDGSGDTFIFSQYLSFSTPTWSDAVGFGTTISWPPVPGGIGAQGNPGMVNAAKGNPYSIAYIGISFKSATSAAGLGEAMLQNRSGKFVLANEHSVSAAVAATTNKTPKDERISLIFASGPDSYPIINYEYVIVKEQQPAPATAKTLRAFLGWAVDPAGGSAAQYLQQVGFVPLPSPIRKLSLTQVAMIR